MDTFTPRTREMRRGRQRREPLRRSQAEIDAAIRMVATGGARSVRLAGLPAAGRLAAWTAARAGTLGVRCAIERPSSGSLVLRFEREAMR